MGTTTPSAPVTSNSLSEVTLGLASPVYPLPSFICWFLPLPFSHVIFTQENSPCSNPCEENSLPCSIFGSLSAPRWPRFSATSLSLFNTWSTQQWRVVSKIIIIIILVEINVSSRTRVFSPILTVTRWESCDRPSDPPPHFELELDPCHQIFIIIGCVPLYMFSTSVLHPCPVSLNKIGNSRSQEQNLPDVTAIEEQAIQMLKPFVLASEFTSHIVPLAIY